LRRRGVEEVEEVEEWGKRMGLIGRMGLMKVEG